MICATAPYIKKQFGHIHLILSLHSLLKDLTAILGCLASCRGKVHNWFPNCSVYFAYLVGKSWQERTGSCLLWNYHPIYKIQEQSLLKWGKREKEVTMCMVNTAERAISVRQVISQESETTGTKKALHKVHMDTIFRAPTEKKGTYREQRH